MERAEKYGIGVAVVGHILLFGLLSVGFLATPNPLKLESKPIDVSLVDAVSLTAAAPASTEPPATSRAPETGAPEDAAPPAETIAEPLPAVQPEPAPPPKPAPVAKPQPPKPAAKPAPAKPAPAVAKATGATASATKPRPRGSLLGDDFRKSLAISEAKGTATAPRAAAVSATAVAGLSDAIRRQIQPCANRVPIPGPGANLIATKFRIRMARDGGLAARPVLMGQTGVGDDNVRYAQRVAELATSAIIQCAPYKLPPELYEGGWQDIILNYRLPG